MSEPLPRYSGHPTSDELEAIKAVLEDPAVRDRGGPLCELAANLVAEIEHLQGEVERLRQENKHLDQWCSAEKEIRSAVRVTTEAIATLTEESARLRRGVRQLFAPSEAPEGEPDDPALLDERLARARAALGEQNSAQ